MRPFVIILTLALFGCSDSFAPYSSLFSLRVLGVRSDPAMPRAGSPATLRALTFAPAGQAITYRWSVCPVAAKAADNYACPVTHESAVAVLGPGLPAFDLGAGSEASFTHDLAPATLSTVCATGITTPTYAGEVDCDLGYPVTVVLDATAGGRNLRAAFLVYLPIVEDPSTDNQNPVLTDLLVGGVPVDAWDPATTLQAPANVQAVVDGDPAELRPIPTFEGGPGTRRERLTFSWFSDSGTWEKDRTAFLDGDTTLSDASTNPWTAPTELPGSVTMAVVVRDDRGGVGWVMRTSPAGAAP